MEAVQTVSKPSDTIILVSQYANHRILEKEDGKTLFDLKFKNGRLVLSRREYEKLRKIPSFVKRVGYGTGIGVVGETTIQPKSVPIPEVRQNVGSQVDS